MGYSHYWFQEHGAIKEAVWGKICADAEKLIAACPLTLSEQMGSTRPPVIDSERIAFNGLTEIDGYEPFEIKRVPDDSFSFCKTFGRPYNVVVCAVLAVAAEHAPTAIRVQSDGPTEDWDIPVAWTSEVLERSVPNPI